MQDTRTKVLVGDADTSFWCGELVLFAMDPTASMLQKHLTGPLE